MKLDPNLETIKNHHINSIRKHKLAAPIADAENYLEYVLGFRDARINKEMRNFVRHLKLVAQELNHG